MFISVTQNKSDDYIVTICDDVVTIYQNGEKLYANRAKSYTDVLYTIDSAVFDGKRLIFSERASNNLFFVDFSSGCFQKNTEVCSSAIDTVQSVIKLFGQQLHYLAFRDIDNIVRILDLQTMKILFNSPLKNEFLDITCTDDGIFTVIGENEYWDNNEDEMVDELLRRFTNEDEYLSPYSAVDARTFYDTFRDMPMYSYASYKGNIKLPLLIQFCKWPYYKMITPHFAVHYCVGISSMIVSSLEGGNVVCMFELPDGIRSDDCICFNEETFILTILEPSSGKVIRYEVMLESADALEEMNIMYNKAYKNESSLQENKQFKKLVLAARDGCKLKRID